MLFTTAEVAFLVSLTDSTPLDVRGILGIEETSREAVELAGLSSLVIRELCEIDDDGFTLRGEAAVAAASLQSATRCLRGVLFADGVLPFQLYRSEDAGLNLFALGYGVLEVVFVEADTPLSHEFRLMLESVDDPDLGGFMVELVGADNSIAAALGRSAEGHWHHLDDEGALAESVDLNDVVESLVLP
jgi:hypothetical protein